MISTILHEFIYVALYLVTVVKCKGAHSFVVINGDLGSVSKTIMPEGGANGEIYVSVEISDSMGTTILYNLPSLYVSFN